MNFRDELKQLPLQLKRSIARAARKLLQQQPNIHTILLEKKYGVTTADQLTDFELILYYNGENYEENQEIISESIYYGGSGEVSDNYRIYDPGRGYLTSRRLPLPDESGALLYKSPHMLEKRESDYLNYLEEHLKYFRKNDYLDITTINSPEMEKSNPLYYVLYNTYHVEKGYMIYNRLIKQYITMHIELSEE